MFIGLMRQYVKQNIDHENTLLSDNDKSGKFEKQ